MGNNWLQQCGEVDQTTLSFSLGVVCAKNFANTLASGSDPDASFTDSGLSVRVVLQRPMAPGWWQIEMTVVDPTGDGRGLYRSAGVWVYSDASFPSDPVGGDLVAAAVVRYYPAGLLETNPATAIIKLEGEACQRLIFVMDSANWVNYEDHTIYPPTGTPWTVDVTGTWLACPECEEPV